MVILGLLRSIFVSVSWLMVTLGGSKVMGQSAVSQPSSPLVSFARTEFSLLDPRRDRQSTQSDSFHGSPGRTIDLSYGSTTVREDDDYDSELLGVLIGASAGGALSYVLSSMSTGSGVINPFFVLGGAIIGLGIGSED